MTKKNNNSLVGYGTSVIGHIKVAYCLDINFLVK